MPAPRPWPGPTRSQMLQCLLTGLLSPPHCHRSMVSSCRSAKPSSLSDQQKRGAAHALAEVTVTCLSGRRLRNLATGSAAVSASQRNDSVFVTPSSSAPDPSSSRAIAASADAAPRSKRIATKHYRHIAGRPWGPRGSYLPPPQRLTGTIPPQPIKKSPHSFAVNWTVVMTPTLNT